MKIIVPMAGRGSRLRPHTLTIPKPLIPIAGKPIVQRLVEDIAHVSEETIEEIAFVIAEDFGVETEENLKQIAQSLGAKGTIYYQDKPLGTGHAIMCAQESLDGPCVIAYADTLFRADFKLDKEADSVIWVKQVKNPQAYGVVSLSENNQITGLVEKPAEFVSDLAVIGIYYFKDGSVLKEELQAVLDANLMHGGEYQINDGIKQMQAKGYVFKPGKIEEWMDCGNKNVTVETNGRMLQFLQTEEEKLISPSAKLENASIIPPVYLGDDVVIKDSTIGPNVSVGKGTVIENSTIEHSLIQNYSTIKNAQLKNAMIGNYAKYNGNFTEISIGDYSELI
ncbi:sugar phosphate nucleotidyltransferase [Leeuwenhoekiella aequorea]|uniref:Glucose-1-phosphate thymidylyltransferase n=1 Tax=Leeuwenhoekiella aequorea TaxID=283736 RepID=A0A4Q0PCK4_9FLAO|nr:sugar phosphate nucleotidyltransferase [Leeuwenhoekiella aequorea]RXG24381.1 glucose-1-phosphate thymidylyltransferase [Leeuwenhoekiella aequorea]